jgi:hypothetical protein
MRLSIPIFLLSATLPTVLGFTPSLPTRTSSSTPLCLAEGESKPEVEPDSHEELMYTLGVNLARQLGDVRPLVENGDELALVAKGLLDAVVGRLDEPAQTVLLAKRGKDLNQLITDRANAIKEKLEQAGREVSMWREYCGSVWT